ncbi:MAG: hypothetical protein CR986_07290 [Ignavibacteriae bacterium]|nr:MAG: hypothetical protein CR986_07290 [Ignavibacteriota bacterium]
MKLRKWNKLNERTVFSNKYWKYKLDNFEIESGPKGEYHYVHSPGSTMVVPFVNESTLLITNQYRYLNQKESLEFPCGAIEEGFSAQENAHKEFREETGKDGKLKFIGEFSPYSGVSNEICSVYLATELFDNPLESDETEEFEILEISVNNFEKLIRDNTIWDGLTLASWVLAKNYLDL